jgi:hypothetical protein
MVIVVPYETLTLTLFVPRIVGTENSNYALTPYDFAVLADFFD